MNMSLLRLLTAGRSLVGLKKAETRYHLPGERSLPKFGSKKNPFRATVVPEKAGPGEEGVKQAKEGAAGAADSGEGQGVMGAGADGEERSHTDFAKVPEAGSAGKGVPEKPLTGGENGRTGIRAFLLWRRAKKPRVRRGAGLPLVQGELSLEGVRVVRNDLSETDVEVIRTSQPGGTKGSRPLSGAGPKLAGAAAGWGATAGRMLGLGKM